MLNLVQLVRGGTAISLDGRNPEGSWVRGITSDGAIGWLVSGAVNITLRDLNGIPNVTVDTPFLLPAPAPNTTGPQFSDTGSANDLIVSATAGVNVRTGPGRTYRRIDGVTLGEGFNVDGRNFTGTWVRGITARANVGWVSARYLSITTAQIDALPLVDIDTPFTLTAPAGGGAPSNIPITAPVANTAPVTGFSYGGHVAGWGEAATNWMRVAGMTWAKRQIRYFDGQNPNDFAGLINDAHARGFHIVLGVVGVNPSDVNIPGYFDRYASFMAGLAALGADALEVWNEPNLDREWVAPVDPARYTDLLRASYLAIKAANPNTLVISGAPAPTGAEAAFPGGQVMNDDRFLAGMAAAGAANYMDCVGTHYNEGIVPPNWTSGDPRGDYYTRYLPTMMNVYYNAFGGSRPLCFTELGYLTPEGFGPLPSFFGWAENVTVAQQAAWLDQAVSIARNSGRVRLFIIWNIDFTGYGADPVGGYAIIRPGGGCPACEALGQ